MLILWWCWRWFPPSKQPTHEYFQSPFNQQAAEAVGASACRPWYGFFGTTCRRPTSGNECNYKLIKEDPTADISAALIQAQEEYNAGN
jgi:hypothetical protein